MRLLATFAVAATVLTTTSAQAPLELAAERFAAPGVMVFSGTALGTRVVLSDWTENQRLMAGLAQSIAVSDAALRARPRLDVVMYWGAEWSRFASTADSLALLAKIEQAQHGEYYPAWRGQPAVWVFDAMGSSTGGMRSVSRDAAAILRTHGLPAPAE